MKTGRNEPCPCGSGKKYKHCCLTGAQAQPDAPEDLTWRRLRRLLEEHRKDMLRFTLNLYGRGVLGEAWREFLPEDEEPFDPRNRHMTVFMPWLFHFWSPDPADTEVSDRALHGRIPTAEYLARKKRLEPLLREYLESCLVAPLSVLEVESADPGRGLALRDLFTAQAHLVAERSGSKLMQPGDLVFGQVAEAGGIALLEICQGFAIPPIRKIAVLEFRKQCFPRTQSPAPERVRDLDLEIVELYHEIATQIFDPRPPTLRNTDGDLLSPRRVVYDVPSAEEAFHALKHLALAVDDDELLADARRDAGGRLQHVQFSWLRQGNAQTPGLENTILGSITLEGTRLEVEVNSDAREQTLRGLVAAALGERARYRATEIRSMERLLEEARTASRAEPHDLAQLPEVQAKVTELLQRHYESWVNEKLPALGGRSPLEAMGDPAGREAVAALVRQIERDGTRMTPSLDAGIVRRLRERLGLA